MTPPPCPSALAGTVSTALFAPDDQALSRPMLIFPSLARAALARHKAGGL